MATVSANTLSTNAPDYVGKYFQLGNRMTPILSVLGSVNGGRIKEVSSLKFSMGQSTSDDNALAQTEITEAQSIAAGTPVTYQRAEAVNTCKIIKKDINVSYTAKSETGLLAGVPQHDQELLNMSETDLQIMENMDRAMRELEYDMVNGTYQAKASGVAPKIGGLLTSCTTNTKDAAGSDLSRDHLDEVLQNIFDNNGFLNENTFIILGSIQKRKLGKLYAHEPEDRRIAGANIQLIETDFGMLSVLLTPIIPTNSIIIMQADKCYPVACPVPGAPDGVGRLFYEEKAKDAASEGGIVFGQLGFDFTHESFHGTITNLGITF